MTDNDQMKIAEAKNSFTGKKLTASQFDETWALASIMHRSIQKSGGFIERLTDYSRAFADAEKLDQTKGEIIIRDIFKARYGETMNDMREGLKTREAALSEPARQEGLEYARRVCDAIRDGQTMPFYQAFDQQAQPLARTFDITENGAKALMKSAFQEVEGRDLYETGKELEKTYHHPVRESAQQAREVKRDQARSRARA